jgi:hypothetical protein
MSTLMTLFPEATKPMHRISMSVLVAPVVFLLGLSGMAAHAATYHVHKSGNNSNSCATAQSTTPSNAKLTIMGGIACLNSGDTLLVASGTYSELITNPPAGLSTSQPTTVKVQPGQSVTIVSPGRGDLGHVVDIYTDYIVFDGFTIDAQSERGGAC